MMGITFGTRIRNMRKKAGLTQRELAELMGVSPQAACKWEKDLACPDIMSLPRLSHILHTTLDAMFAQELERINEEDNAYNFSACTRKIV